MANTIELAKNYLDIIDEVYKSASVTADLTSDPSMMRAGANVSEILYPQIEVGGLGNYDRNSGYTSAAVSLKWATARFNYDRCAKLEVDTMDRCKSRMDERSGRGSQNRTGSSRRSRKEDRQEPDQESEWRKRNAEKIHAGHCKGYDRSV